MTIRNLSLPGVTALGLLLLGCNKEIQPAADKDNYNAKPVAAASNTAAAPAPAKNEMTTTASGLQYQILKRGSGTVSPKPTDTVRVHYHGTLLDGTVFDSSVERGEPISFALNGVIKGWTEGLQLMKVGDKFKFIIPPFLAYGENSPSQKIPPNSALVFEVELLGIQ
jgi:peptidylprolyl isomerase